MYTNLQTRNKLPLKKKKFIYHFLIFKETTFQLMFHMLIVALDVFY